ncbi:MAG: hypothetical protein ACC656_04980 [Candidatus Heimdallarchaeota archaeon]
MHYKIPTPPYFKFDELKKESKQNALTYSPTLKFLAKLKNITSDKITKADVMKHFLFNNFIFTKDGRGLKHDY